MIGRDEGAESDGAARARGVDRRYADLSGEASQQRVAGEPEEGSQAHDVYRRPPQETHDGRAATYYDRPVLKEPVWIWAVPAYFYVGGVAGAASVLGEIAKTFGRGDVDGLVTRCRWIGAFGGGIGTGLLVYDLGRPERFLNMLRVFRPSSPMSVGSWTLVIAAPVFAASAVLTNAGGALGRVGNAIGKVAGFMGLPLSVYTAVLLTNTAVPAWQGARRSMPFLFASSAMSGASALCGFFDLNEREQEIVRRFGILGGVAESLAALALDREVGAVEKVAEPYKQGPSGSLWKTAKNLSTASTVLSVLPGTRPAKRYADGIIGTAAALTTRFAVFGMGRPSARDPKATFQSQRAGAGGAAVLGRAAVVGPDDRRATE